MSLPKNDWLHGDIPTAAQMNAYGTALDAAHDVLGDVQLNYPTLSNISSAQLELVHVCRYLWFQSSGMIVDPSGVGTSISLSEENSQPTRYDLESVTWLFYGAFYQVTGVTWCIEAES